MGINNLEKKRGNLRFDCDWSSDVCSSDLALHRGRQRRRLPHPRPGAGLRRLPQRAARTHPHRAPRPHLHRNAVDVPALNVDHLARPPGPARPRRTHTPRYYPRTLHHLRRPQHAGRGGVVGGGEKGGGEHTMTRALIPYPLLLILLVALSLILGAISLLVGPGGGPAEISAMLA